MKTKPSKIPIVSKSGSSTSKKLEVAGSSEKNLLYRILPKNGNYCVAVLPLVEKPSVRPSMTYKWFDKRKDVIRYVTAFKSKTKQIFIAMASFKKPGTARSGRRKVDADSLRVFFMDIDCGFGTDGKPKTYANQSDGEKALLAFCKNTGIPIPAIVNSGNGLYALLPLTTSVKSEIWEAVAIKLKRLVAAIEPGLDQDGLIADYARVLRPIESTNRKFPKNPKNVSLIRDCEPIELDALVAILDKAIGALPARPAAPSPNKSNSKRNDSSDQDKSSSAIRIVKKCAVLADFRDSKGNVSEPLWYAAIGVLRHCEEAPYIIHEWSSGHPGYSVEETDAKIAQHTMPPTTCSLISGLCPDLCSQCKYNGKVKSPISLGLANTFGDIPDYIEELNSKTFVSRFGSKTVVCSETFDKQPKRFKLVMQNFSDFKNFHSNKKITIGMNRDGNPITIPLGKAWLDHPSRRQYEDIKLSPEGNIEGVYNLWRGFQVELVEGSWELMRSHIFNVICDSNKKVFKYVLKWLARLIQKPWKTGEVALVLQGKKGIGKGMFVNALCTFFGQNSMSIYNAKHLTGNFNAHLEACILLYVDEAFWAGDKSGEGVLKGLITEPTIAIERKNIDVITVRNLLHIIMSSNNDWVVPASADERRYCVLKVSDRHINDAAYFKALKYEIDNGGLAAMLFYLKNKDITGFNVRVVPNTDGLADQKMQSLDPLKAWWHHKLQTGDLLPGYGWGDVPVHALYDDYISSVQKLGGNVRRVNDTAFALQLRKVLPKKWPKKSRHPSINEARRVSHYEFPSLKVCRLEFERVMDIDTLDWK